MRNLYEIIKKTKRFIGIKIEKSVISKILIPINLILFHWSERMHWKRKGGKLKGNVYYVIRARGSQEGLLSLYFYVLRGILYAEKKKMIPVVDFNDERCQYHVKRLINNTNNAWEYYFTQPVGISMKDIGKNDNVLLSGWVLGKDELIDNFPKGLNRVRDKDILRIARDMIQVNKKMEEIASERYKELFQDINGEILGVFIRGTDYVELKPKGHPRQPSCKEVVDAVIGFTKKKNVERIYLVTEDKNYYSQFKRIFGNTLVVNDDDYVDYNKGDYISASFDTDPFERGKNYLIRLILLSKCDYLISSIANGSLFAKLIKTGEYLEEKWFELGEYK